MIFIFSILVLYTAVAIFYMAASGAFKNALWFKSRQGLFVSIAVVMNIWVLGLNVSQWGWERGGPQFLSIFAVMGPVTIILHHILKPVWVKTVFVSAGLALVAGVVASVGALSL
ncbi:MAG: hypothetical protein COA69_12985 [Robiginitomaculum sp.]|nr:MAG: hypothetical protein COA69_12985 [Robiginitomaculum sp.]